MGGSGRRHASARPLMRQLRWVSFDGAAGRRPVVVLGDERRLENGASTIMVIPMSTQNVTHADEHTQLVFRAIGAMTEMSVVHCEAITSVACTRVGSLIGYLDDHDEARLFAGIAAATGFDAFLQAQW